MYKAVLFDMDGTLLAGKNKHGFLDAYMDALGEHVKEYVNKEQFLKAMYSGLVDMIKNNGQATNEEVFLKRFRKDLPNGEALLPFIDQFYEEKFNGFSHFFGYDPICKEIVDALTEKNYKVIVATNPMLPENANAHRLCWAGIEDCKWSWITSYHNSSYTKPNPEYFLEISQKIGVVPKECLMVGNEVGDDMIAETIGMDTFLILDDFSGKGEEEYKGKRGTRKEFLEWVQQLPAIIAE